MKRSVARNSNVVGRTFVFTNKCKIEENHIIWIMKFHKMHFSFQNGGDINETQYFIPQVEHAWFYRWENNWTSRAHEE